MPRRLEGTVIAGKYRIVTVLGEGGMGVVYRAEQLDVGGEAVRSVALKTVLPALSEDTEFARRFLRECRIAMQLRSPHVVTVHDSGRTADGELYYSMELVEGPSLREYIARDEPLSLEAAVDVLTQICHGLAEAHGGTDPVVHRDLKPANVFVEDRHGRCWVKIGDFGIAKVLGEESTSMTGSGRTLGTPRYMAPEQWRGGEIGPPADLYALGVIAYEVLTGNVPFTGPPEALMYKHLNVPPPPLPEQVPPALREIVGRLLDKDPQRRPDAIQTARALEAAQSGDGSPAAARPVEQLQARRRSLPRRAAIVLLGLLAVGAILVFGARELRSRLERAPARVAMVVPTTAPAATPSLAPNVKTVQPEPEVSPLPVSTAVPSAAVPSATGPQEPVPLASCDQIPPGGPAVAAWIEDYRVALEHADLTTLENLGVIRNSTDRESLRRELAGRSDYDVRIENLEAVASERQVQLRFDRNERWRSARTQSAVIDFIAERRTLVHRDCRVVSID